MKCFIVFDHLDLPKIEIVEQNMLDGNSAVIAETGDSWFNCQKLRLPENCG